MREFDAARDSGPVVARLFLRLLAAIFCIAWTSLGWQIDVLIGRRGLLPAAPFFDAMRAQGVGFARLPSVFWFDASDAALHAGIAIGLAVSLAALFGLAPRVCLGISTLLYLSFANAAGSFLSFQWDNLLLECGALAIFLPRERPAAWIHVLFRILLVKLYVESGIAKWDSSLGDWQDGSAMTWYYETAPLPVWLGWYAHHLPAWWHHLESRAVLVIELLLPWLAFAPRRARLALCVVLSGFQLLNLATANYGFFVYLALALHVFLLTDADVERALGWVRRTHRPAHSGRPRQQTWLRLGGAATVAALYIGLSLTDAAAAFAPLSAGTATAIAALQRLYEPWRLVNTYHLFGSITRERIEPEFQVEVDGTWQALQLQHKPGDPLRAPDLIAPHQPRVDFQLWFYGLSFQGGAPPYVAALLERLCHDPTAVQTLFRQPLPVAPGAVRIAFWRYRFSDAATRQASGAWWTRTPVAESRPIPCGAAAAG
ncbi:MAG: lipase maturation factor family protein [bacterium]